MQDERLKSSLAGEDDRESKPYDISKVTPHMEV